MRCAFEGTDWQLNNYKDRINRGVGWWLRDMERGHNACKAGSDPSGSGLREGIDGRSAAVKKEVVTYRTIKCLENPIMDIHMQLKTIAILFINFFLYLSNKLKKYSSSSM